LKAQTRAGKVIGARVDAIVVRSMTTHRERLAIAVATAFLLVVPTCSPAFAHTGSGSGGFVGGFLHPVFGPDHVVAMVAVGLWGAFLGPPAIWLLPIVFPLVMAGGGVLGILGVPLPGVEIGIAISAIVLGLMVALAARPPLWVAAVLVGAFAIFHGHAHGGELPPGTDAVAFSVGFVVATGLLHLTGIAFGLLARWPAGRVTVRAAGGAIALAGLAFLSGVG
jgi:urease accessory protein